MAAVVVYFCTAKQNVLVVVWAAALFSFAVALHTWAFCCTGSNPSIKRTTSHATGHSHFQPH